MPPCVPAARVRARLWVSQVMSSNRPLSYFELQMLRKGKESKGQQGNQIHARIHSILRCVALCCHRCCATGKVAPCALACVSSAVWPPPYC
jgi:hypothetical protein